MTTAKRAVRPLFVAWVVLALTACAAPMPSSAPGSGTEASVAVTPARIETLPQSGATAVHTKPAPPMSDPLPPELVRPPIRPPAIDQTCKINADCVVKDVGSCCGAMPACVNRDSRTDPAAVQAECARKGLSSVCGFNEITACSCAGGQCISEQEPVGGWINGAAPAQVDR